MVSTVQYSTVQFSTAHTPGRHDDLHLAGRPALPGAAPGPGHRLALLAVDGGVEEHQQLVQHVLAPRLLLNLDTDNSE